MKRSAWKRSLAGGLMAVSALFTVLPAPAHAAGDWHGVALPFFWPEWSLWGLAAAAPDSVWISGGQGAWCIPGPTPFSCLARSSGNPVIRRWTGSSWKEYPLRGVADASGPIQRLAASGNEIWAQSSASGYLARFDGSAFQAVQPPEGGSINSLWSTPAGVWVKAGAEFHRWNGSGWTRQTLPDGLSGPLGELEATEPGEAWTTARDPASGEHHLLRWDGTTWQDVVTLPRLDRYGGHPDFTVSAADEVFAISTYAPSDDRPSRLFRWKDGALTEIAAPPGVDVRQLYRDGLGAVWATGVPQGDPYYRYYRHTGNGWEETRVPAEYAVAEPVAVPGSDAFWGMAGFGNRTIVTNS
jgi:hypothetical protein